jgi:hypothetical protein
LSTVITIPSAVNAASRKAHRDFVDPEKIPLRAKTRQNSITLKWQGGLFEAKVNMPSSFERRGGGLRGVVNDFSAPSRLRLLKKFAALERRDAVFLTLTYDDNFPSPARSKRDLDNFLNRIRRRDGCELASGLWRFEFQRRGAPHFHLVLFNLPFIDKLEIKRMWSEVTGCTPEVFTRIEWIAERKKLYGYVSKYVAKTNDERIERVHLLTALMLQFHLWHFSKGAGRLVHAFSSELAKIHRWHIYERIYKDRVVVAERLRVCGFNYISYLCGEKFHHPKRVQQLNRAVLAGCFNSPWLASLLPLLYARCACGTIGRWWGVFKAANLPASHSTIVTIRSYDHYYKYRRMARRLFRKISRDVERGFALLLPDVGDWLRAWEMLNAPPARLVGDGTTGAVRGFLRVRSRSVGGAAALHPSRFPG